MAASADIAAELRKCSADELASALQTVVSERPALKEKLVALWHSPSEQWPRDESGTWQAALPSLPKQPAGEVQASAALRVPSDVSPRSQALLCGSPGGHQQQTPASRINEIWSLLLLMVFNCIMFVTITVSYCLSIGSGRVSYHDFFISSSIDTGWAHRVGDLGISVAFVAFMLMMFTRYVAVKALLEPLPPSAALLAARASKAALVIEAVAAFGALGVGAFNQSFNYMVHISFAFITFFFATLSLFIQTYIDELIFKHTAPEVPRVARQWRLCRWVLSIVSLLGLVSMFGTGSYGLVAESSASELCMASALFGYYLTWMGSSGTGYIVGFEVFAYDRPQAATARRLQSCRR